MDNEATKLELTRFRGLFTVTDGGVCHGQEGNQIHAGVLSRQYRVDLGNHAWAALYLQGVNEATHGISDSLLSLLAHRSQEIADDLLARRAIVA